MLHSFDMLALQQLEKNKKKKKKGGKGENERFHRHIWAGDS